MLAGEHKGRRGRAARRARNGGWQRTHAAPPWSAPPSHPHPTPSHPLFPSVARLRSGTQDKIFPAATSAKAAAATPGSWLVNIQGAGHVSWYPGWMHRNEGWAWV